MKTLDKLEDEIPVTKEGLDVYIKEMEKAFKPVRLQYNRMDDLLKKAKQYREKMR